MLSVAFSRSSNPALSLLSPRHGNDPSWKSELSKIPDFSLSKFDDPGMGGECSSILSPDGRWEACRGRRISQLVCDVVSSLTDRSKVILNGKMAYQFIREAGTPGRGGKEVR